MTLRSFGLNKNIISSYCLAVGNLFIVITVVRTPSLHTGINLFVCNMAVSDMMMCLTAAPLTPITSFTGRWFLGQLPCVLLPGCQVLIPCLTDPDP